MNMTTTLPTKVLDFQTTREVPFIVPYILLPAGHDLCFYTFDHAKSVVYVNLYMPNPNKDYTVKIRGDEIDSNESLADYFRDDHCGGCQYYFDTRTETDEETDDDGNTVQVTREITSRCGSYRFGVDGIDDCPEGHELPSFRDEDTEEYEWSTQTADSGPLYFLQVLTPPRRNANFTTIKVTAAMSFAEQVYSYDGTEYAWYTGPMHQSFNIYEGSLPSGICWGADKNHPVTFHLDEVYSSYVNSVFNDDTIEYNDYNDDLSDLLNIFNEVQLLDPKDHSESEYKDQVENISLYCDAKLIPTSSKDHIILSERDEPAAGFIYLNRTVDPTLFNRMYVSGVPFKVEDPLSFDTVLLPIYRYEYVNPADESQRINGFITKPNRYGTAWFMANNSMTGKYVESNYQDKPGFGRAIYSYSPSTELSNNVLTVLGQIQL